jgi:hypothetical protein
MSNQLDLKMLDLVEKMYRLKIAFDASRDATNQRTTDKLSNDLYRLQLELRTHIRQS